MIIVVGLGGMVGAIIRYYCGKFIMERSKLHFPLGTWIINITGSFFLGSLAHLYLLEQVANWIWFFLGIGFLGAYTTFSTFGYETIQLIQKKRLKTAILYILTSTTLGIAFAWIGFQAVQ
ncbi:fluoride efflux transporter CrcB [Ammoniphilus sp. YIM 78166]|uniref:fluoride efflux transporter CrcB n=1 Tax=Ammoniphilus sp. YIM 78166 TaxID=1644106 RepID=UPI00106FA377|nr:fluoride efflux transporter CrcB [Ammoniphilus sp. YIM 78166]